MSVYLEYAYLALKRPHDEKPMIPTTTPTNALTKFAGACVALPKAI
jgi:hypothetical protein